MNKTFIFSLLFVFCIHSGFFDDPNTSINRNQIMTSLQKTEKNIKESKNSLNNIFMILIGVSGITSYLLYNAINNPHVYIELGEKNPNHTLEDIHDYLKFGFGMSLVITLSLIYMWYKYNQSQINIEEEIEQIASQELIR